MKINPKHSQEKMQERAVNLFCHALQPLVKFPIHFQHRLFTGTAGAFALRPMRVDIGITVGQERLGHMVKSVEPQDCMLVVLSGF